MGWIRFVDRQALHYPHGSLAVRLKHKKNLVGSIIHNGQAQNGKEIYASFDYYQYPHDSNLTMTVSISYLSV